MIDTHCHLLYSPLSDDLEGAMERARAIGVDRFILPGTDVSDSLAALEFAKNHEGVYPCVGVHPSESGKPVDFYEELVGPARANSAIVVAIGEVGLDYHYFDGLSDAEIVAMKEAQQKDFRSMIRLARELEKPLIIHTRDAFEDTYAILSECPDLKRVIHCFSGSEEELGRWIEIGCWVSVTGMITYKKNQALRDAIAQVPLDRIMVETDAPFLAPEGFRGTTCEPKYVRNVVECLADIFEKSFEEVEMITTRNAEDFFEIKSGRGE